MLLKKFNNKKFLTNINFKDKKYNLNILTRIPNKILLLLNNEKTFKTTFNKSKENFSFIFL
jgi:hypothetical protein